MKLVIDTNVLVSALSSRSIFHWIIQDLMAEKFEIAISYEVLLEYEEILKKKYDSQTAENFLRALQELPNVELSEIYFRWKLLADPDDNKFVDLAISANADYLLSEDNDFKLLQNVDFPKVIILKIGDFRKILYP